MCVVFLSMNIIISRFVLRLELLAGLQNMQQCIFSDWKKLENQSANSGLEGIVLSWRRLSCLNCPSIVYYKYLLPNPLCEFWHVTEPNRQAHVTIGLIMRLVRKPPIRNAHIYPCDSAGYQNKLLCSNLLTDCTNGLDNAWASCNAGYY